MLAEMAPANHVGRYPLDHTPEPPNRVGSTKLPHRYVDGARFCPAFFFFFVQKKGPRKRIFKVKRVRETRFFTILPATLPDMTTCDHSRVTSKIGSQAHTNPSGPVRPGSTPPPPNQRSRARPPNTRGPAPSFLKTTPGAGRVWTAAPWAQPQVEPASNRNRKQTRQDHEMER